MEKNEFEILTFAEQLYWIKHVYKRETKLKRIPLLYKIKINIGRLGFFATLALLIFYLFLMTWRFFFLITS